jgi:hypothetical protein
LIENGLDSLLFGGKDFGLAILFNISSTFIRHVVVSIDEIEGKKSFTFDANEIKADRHQLDLINFENDSLNGNKVLYHMCFDVVDFAFRVVLDHDVDLFFFFFLLEQ